MKNWNLRDVAKHWDETLDYDEINAKTDSYYRRFTDSAPLFSLPNNARILDIDCRTGNGSAFFAKKNKNCHFTGLAVSPLFQSLAQKTFDAGNVSGNTGVFESLPLTFDDSSFDAILCYETIEHMPCPEDFVEELARVLKPGGLLVLTTPNIFWEPIHHIAPILGLHHSEGPHRMLSRRRLRRIFAKNSFLINKEKTFVLVPAGPKFLISIGKAIERILPEWLLRIIALRQTFICQKREMK
jgi:SAM-dependent methyltransferase